MITNIQLFNFVNDVLWYDTMWNLHYTKIKLCVSLYINYTFLNLNCYKNKIKEQICKNSKQETILHEHNILPAHTHTHTFFSLFFLEYSWVIFTCHPVQRSPHIQWEWTPLFDSDTPYWLPCFRIQTRATWELVQTQCWCPELTSSFSLTVSRLCKTENTRSLKQYNSNK